MRFIGVDPGLVTGLCSFYVDEDEQATLVDHYQLDHIGTAAYFEGMREFWKRTPSAGDSTIIAMESFIVTPASTKKNFQPYSLETIGAVRYFVEVCGMSMRMSAPSAHKRLVTDDVLKRAGLYFPGEGHATDAARVALHVAIVDHGVMKWTLKD